MKADADLIDLFGTSQQTLWWDFETRSHCDLKKHGAYRYATDPSTEILCAAWAVGEGAVGEGAVQIWLPGEPFPDEALLALLCGGLLAAHNAGFDRLIWRVAENDHGFPPLEIDETYCTAAQARARGYPGKLEHLGRALGLPADKRKQRRGAALIRKMSIPPFEYSAELMAEMGAYCIQDTETMRECARLTAPLSKIELERYWLSERINDRGLRVDVPLAKAAAAYAVRESEEINQKIARLTNGAVTTGRQFKRLQEWLQPRLNPEAWKLTQVYKTDRQTKETTCKTTLDKTVRFNLLALLGEQPDACLDPAALDVIELLDEAGRTSVAKYQAMADRGDVEDQRVRGAYVFAGAGQTGRWSSTALQLHNFTRKVADNPEEMRSLILAGKELPGGVLDELASMLRPSIIGDFFCGDWSAIEARVMPWLSIAGGGGRHQEYCDQRARERLERMAAGEDMYVSTAASFDGTRQEGKTIELSGQFGGGVGAFHAMGRAFNLSISDEKAQHIVDAWRESNPWAVNFWTQLDNAARGAMRHPGLRIQAGRVEYERVGSVLRCYLPSGRFLSYPDVQWGRDRWNRPCITFLKGSWTAKADAKEWPRCDLYGGLAAENITQGVASDVLADAMMRIEERAPGLIVGHTHDEILTEGAAGYQHEIIREEMRRPPVWGSGLPLAAEFWSGRRYRK